jgi:outer membrane protein
MQLCAFLGNQAFSFTMRYSSLLCILACGLTLVGCTTVKEARKVQNDPEVQLPGEYTMTAEQAGLRTDRPMSLAELEAIALKCNPTVLQASIAVNQAMLALQNTKSQYLPTASLSASHNRATANRDRRRETTRNTGSYSGSLGLNLVLFDFGQRSAVIKQAEKDFLAANEEYVAAKNQVVYTVRKAFFELKRNIGLHDVAVDAVQQYQDHLEQVKLKREIGASMDYDVIKAEVDYQNARLKEITTANSVATGWADLNQALGLMEYPAYTLGEAEVHEYTQNADELMELARNCEPSLAAMRYDVEVASAQIDEAIAALYPSLSISLSGSVSGPNPGLPWLWNLNGGLSLAETLFNGGRNLRAIRLAANSLRLARSRYAAKEQAVYRNLIVAVLTMNRAKQSLEVAKLSEKSAQQNLDIVNEKYKHGKATAVDRTDAQVSYSTAKADVVTAHFDYLEAQTAVAYLIGE